MVDRQTIMAQAARKLQSDFNALTPIPHNQLRGQEAERLVRQFLNNHLPRRFAAGAGFILDPAGSMSKQTDVVIYDAHNCPVYFASEDAAIFPSDNVAAVVEVKSALSKDELGDAWSKIEQAKSLAKSPPPDVPWLVQTQTLGVVFAFSSTTSLDSLRGNYFSLAQSRGLGRHPDLVVVLDQGLITLSSKVRGMEGWNLAFFEGLGGAAAEGSHIAVAQADFGELTLDGFLRVLLAHLIFFRNTVDHPGLDWKSFPGQAQMKTTYLTSITSEEDPAKKAELLRRYREEAEQEFGSKPEPTAGGG